MSQAFFENNRLPGPMPSKKEIQITDSDRTCKFDKIIKIAANRKRALYIPFRYKLIVLITTIIIVVLVGIFTIVQSHIEENAVKNIKEDLVRTREIVTRLMEDRWIRLWEIATGISGNELVRVLLQDKSEQLREKVKVAVGQDAIRVDEGVGNTDNVPGQLDVIDASQDLVEMLSPAQLILQIPIRGVQGYVQFRQARLHETQSHLGRYQRGVGVDVDARPPFRCEPDQAVVAPYILAEHQGLPARDVDVGRSAVVVGRCLLNNPFPPIQAH